MVESRAIPALALSLTGGSSRTRVPSDVASGFDRLFAEEYRRVVGIARRVVRDPVAAEDVAQDVFLELHRRFGDEPGAAAPGWLHAAAVHGALNALRGERRRAAREERFAPAPRQVADPQVEVEAAETRQAVRASLARMPRRHATVLALRYSGLSYAEIAAAMGIAVNGVGTRLRRAEACFRKEVSDASI